MDEKRMIMNFTVSPSFDDFEVIAEGIVDTLPEELAECCQDLMVQVEDFPDDAVQADYDVDDPYELLALFKSGKELSPGVERKESGNKDLLVLFRRPILDVWCENGEDLTVIIREVIIEEIGKSFDFSGDDIDELTGRHYQGML